MGKVQSVERTVVDVAYMDGQMWLEDLPGRMSGNCARSFLHRNWVRFGQSVEMTVVDVIYMDGQNWLEDPPG